MKSKSMKDRRVWVVRLQTDWRDSSHNEVTVEAENIEKAVKKARALSSRMETQAVVSCVQVAVIDR